MNLTLTRKDTLRTGIFGVLESLDESMTLFTLEHAYEISELAPPVYFPKMPPGVYTCKRGLHQLEGMKEPFETFEITNVPGHTNILFHTGNLNADSAGCVLLGLFRSADDSIMQSRAAFSKFMQIQDGIDEFILTVI